MEIRRRDSSLMIDDRGCPLVDAAAIDGLQHFRVQRRVGLMDTVCEQNV